MAVSIKTGRGDYLLKTGAPDQRDAEAILLTLVLERLLEKPQPFTVLDTHAGVGLYDLASEAARRSPEWQEGALRLMGRELAAAPAVRSVLDVLWPELEPQRLLTRLYQQPHLLDLADDERAAIARNTPGPWTPADVPLLDELAGLLGPLDATERTARRRRAYSHATRGNVEVDLSVKGA